jgi:hypothetical protein
MTTVHIRQGTTVSLNRFVAALINFGPGRGEIFTKQPRALGQSQRPRRHLD